MVGTQTEMLKLAKDMGVVDKNVKSFNDVSFDQAILAIHKVQEQLGLAGTAGYEAQTTLSGSMQMLKASWDNFLSGQGNLGDVIDSAGIAFDNLTRIAGEAIDCIMESFYGWFPQLIETGKEMLNKLGQGIQDNFPFILGITKQLLTDIITTIMDNLPQIVDMGVEILMALIDGISEAMPELAPKIVEVTIKILETLADHNDEMADAGVTFIIKLGEGIIRGIPRMLPSLVKVMNSILTTITNWLPNILQLGVKMTLKLAEGIGIPISAISNKITEIRNAIYNKIAELIYSAYQWGSDFVHKFASGITSGLTDLNNKVTSVANSIKAKLHFSRPDEGPLRDYETWMPDMVKGLANSLEKASPLLLSKVKALSSEMAMSLSPSLNGGTYSYSPSMNVVVNNNIETDPLGQMVSQVKTFSNGAKNDYNYGYGG